MNCENCIKQINFKEMDNYNGTNRYQMLENHFKKQKNSYQYKRLDSQLRQTIDLTSFETDYIPKKKDKTDLAYQSLRHTTGRNETLSSLLGRPYKYFQPRSKRQKSQSIKSSQYEDSSYLNSRKCKPYQAPVNTTCQDKVSSLKDSTDFQKQPKNSYKTRQKLSHSSILIPPHQFTDEKKTPIRIKQQENAQSPYTFIKKNKILDMTPHSIKQDTDDTSTKIGISSSSCETQFKLLKLKSIHQISHKPTTSNDFAIIKHLGQGRFGTVSMAIHKKTGFLVAIKKVKKAAIKTHKLENQFIIEIKMQLFLNHPNILKLYGYFDDLEHIYLILQFMEEGTLFNKMKKEKQKHLNEKSTSEKMDDVIHAISYMHNLEIAHRDIKPQNIVISNGICKLCDFGLAAVCTNRRSTLCGTIDYAPPEVLEGKQYGISMDLWCLGVLCYELLVGKAPFYHFSRKQTIQKIINTDSNELKMPDYLSKQAVDFINKMLIKDPEERMQAKEALRHQFIIKHVQKDNQRMRGKYR